jgi:hypothetical protein
MCTRREHLPRTIVSRMRRIEYGLEPQPAFDR